MDGWLPWVIGVGVGVVLLVIGGAVRRPRGGAGRRSTPRRGGTRATLRRPGARPAGSRTAGPKTSRTAIPHPRPAAPPGPARTARPRAGEIWWAEVPYEDGTGSKVRPCLVLRARRGGADVLKITSRDRSDRTDHVRLPTKQWDPRADRDSFLDLTEPIRVAPAAFANRAGACDPAVWRAVRLLHGARHPRGR